MYVMKRYTTAQARQRIAELLDSAERGQPVVIERRGIRFVVRARRDPPRRMGRRKSAIAQMDPAVAAGDWTWSWNADGLRFATRRRRR
jgi:antitoxin (DNA-binding transcriptional repressor) of toxin-antitoxin stability system